MISDLTKTLKKVYSDSVCVCDKSITLDFQSKELGRDTTHAPF